MALYLIELTPATASKDEATALIETVSNSLSEGAELIETQVSADHKLIFAIIESENTAFCAHQANLVGANHGCALANSRSEGGCERGVF